MLKKIYLPPTKNKHIFFPYSKGKRTFTFKEGINCIIGPNASGKTVLLNALRWKHSSEGKGELEKVVIPTYQDSEYTFRVSFMEPVDKDTILWYEPQEYSRFNQRASEDVFSRNIEEALTLSLYRNSEAECNSLYFSHWVERHKDAIANKPSIIVADEIENSNDPLTIGVLMNTFRQWCKNNPKLQILIATHNPFVLAYADNVVETSKDWKNVLKKLYFDVLTKRL